MIHSVKCFTKVKESYSNIKSIGQSFFPLFSKIKLYKEITQILSKRDAIVGVDLAKNLTYAKRAWARN